MRCYAVVIPNAVNNHGDLTERKAAPLLTCIVLSPMLFKPVRQSQLDIDIVGLDTSSGLVDYVNLSPREHSIQYTSHMLAIFG